MATKDSSKIECKDKKSIQGCSTSSAIYGLGFLGTLVYFVGHAPDFTTGVTGVIKAIIWPAILVYKALELLKM